ncbi:MAG: riboflavin synthase [Cyanobacteria bacterium]|nr:riboflavin synthase [Cyanobacteriota bacterium]
MFSGIVEEVGRIVATSDSSDGRRLKIAAKQVLSDVKLGDSIAVSGVCLTVTQFTAESFSVDASFETLRRSKLGSMKNGDRVNLERALKFSDRLGGHLVSGHVDALASVSSIKKEGFSSIIEFSVPASLAPFFIEKGSVSIDGISLTVAYLKPVSGDKFLFAIAAIPHTLEITTLSSLQVGEPVNIEADLIGKYVARWMHLDPERIVNKEGLSQAFLTEHGYT